MSPLSLATKNIGKLVAERTETAEKLHNDIEFYNFIYKYKGSAANINLNNFINAGTIFEYVSSKEKKIADAKKKSNQIKIKSKQYKNRRQKLNKQENNKTYYQILQCRRRNQQVFQRLFLEKMKHTDNFQ